jgi:hypothetical protein
MAMSEKSGMSMGPMGVVTPFRAPERKRPFGQRRIEPSNDGVPSPVVRRDPPAPVPPAPKPESGVSVPPPMTPPAPNAGFQALMEFTYMLEYELAAVERRALEHSEAYGFPPAQQ